MARDGDVILGDDEIPDRNVGKILSE